MDAKRIHEASKALGLYALNMPESLGGAGLSNVDRMLCEEQFGHTSDILVRRAFGNVYEALNQVIALGNDTAWHGSCHTPSILVDGLSVTA